MLISTFAVLLIMSYLSQVTNGHAQDFNTASFVRDINGNTTDSITREDVENFFPGTYVSKCDFVRTMIPAYSGDSTLVSVMYDVLQSDDDVTTLQEDEFVRALLNQARTAVGASEFRENVQRVLQQVHDITPKPYQFTDGSGMFPHNDYRADAWADDVDTNNDEQISLGEISQWMRGPLDADGNSRLERCEFVEAMRRYSQHPVTAAKMYDVIFKSRDLHWADVDSTFLAVLISTKDREGITTAEFRDFFSYQNDLASGAIVPIGGSQTGPDENAGTTTTGATTFTFGLCLIAALLVHLH